MKLIFTFGFLLFSVFTKAADLDIDSLPVKAVSIIPANPPEKANTSIRIRCLATRSPFEPLLVIDGSIYDYNQMNELNPNDIASINILKNTTATALYGSRGADGVIIITTKTVSTKKFIIKDFLSGAKVPLATVYFISKNDTIKTVANDSGILVMDKLKPAEQYRIIVSSTGYKAFTAAVKGKEQVILLERDVKECSEVTVKTSSHSHSGCRRINYECTRITNCELTYVKITKNDIPALTNYQTAKQSIYPNPVQRNNIFNIEFAGKQDEAFQFTVLDLHGKQIMQQWQKAVQGLNHLSIIAEASWSAGIYIVLLRNDEGAIVKQEKLIVQ